MYNTVNNYEEKFQKLASHVEGILESAPGCHDWEHTLRVLHNARLILKHEPDADSVIVELAAILHDISRPEELNAKGKICHAEKGAERAADLLDEFGFTDFQLIESVKGCIRKHRFRTKTGVPETPEEKVIYDADKLDSIGAVGLGRAFHFAGRVGAKLHNTKEVAVNSESYSVEDTAYREYLVKLKHIPKKMLTDEGRRLAVERGEFMETFFNVLNRETYGKI